MISHYSLPIDFSALMQGQSDLKSCDLETSVQQHVFLMLITRFGELRFDRGYGCKLWEYDFDYLNTIHKAKAALELSIKDTIEKQEPRLGNVSVKINFDTKAFLKNRFSEQKQIKKQVAIQVQGILMETNTPFHPPAYLIYLSPVSI